MAEKKDWVRIRRVVLAPEERTGKLPEDTKSVPLEMWVKGRLQNEAADIGDMVTVLTRAGRLERGILLEMEPCYPLNYGSYVDEILVMEEKLRTELWEGEENDH